MDGSLRVLMRNIYDCYSTFPSLLLQYIAVVLIKALNYLKSKLNVIHRDIKPDNILYKLEGPGCIKLADFGISRTLADSAVSTIIATMTYLPPERAQNPQMRYGVESDIWGVGMVLLELVKKKHPLLEDYESEVTLDKVQNKIYALHDGLAVPQDLNLKNECHEFISTCLRPYETRPRQYSTLLGTEYIQNFDEDIFVFNDYVRM